jgi:hypothetical protein|tara:strand:+ start:530 stop:754 length:225 start_codon:yes stop_codon:yes gene_type:complete
MTNKENVLLLVNAKQILNNISEKKQDQEYIDILQKINEYIDKYCDHSKIYDYIDIDVEYSQRICYCEYCYTTFN